MSNKTIEDAIKDGDIIEPNKLDRTSSSGLGAYLQCPRQWANTYINNAPRTDTVFTMFGRIIHEVFEHLANEPAKQNFEDARKLFDAYWQEYKLTDFDFYNRGIEIIDAYLSRDEPFAGEIIGVEVQFGYDVKTDTGTPMYVGNVPILGFIDRVNKLNEDTIIIRDYKTNIQPFSHDEVENHLQMSIYDIVARQLYPWAKNVILILDQPLHGEFRSTRTDQQRKDTIKFIENVWQQMLYDKEFKEKLNEYCRYCDLRGDCNTYKQALIMKTAIVDENDALALWEEKEILTYQKKAIEGKLGEIEVAIKNLMIADRKNTLVVGDSEFYFSQQRRKEYPVNAVREIMSAFELEHVLNDCLKLEKTKLEKHPEVKGQKIIMTMIDNCANVSFTKPSLNKRKIANLANEA